MVHLVPLKLGHGPNAPTASPLPYGADCNVVNFSYDSLAGVTLYCSGTLDISEVKIQYVPFTILNTSYYSAQFCLYFYIKMIRDLREKTVTKQFHFNLHVLYQNSVYTVEISTKIQ